MKYEIEVISPLHIGSGRIISPIEYVIDDKFYRVDMDRLFQDRDFDIDAFINSATTRTQLYLGSFAPILGKKHCKYAVNFSDPSIRFDLQGVLGSPSAEVKELIKTLGMPYIPGTSIKGAIRTALLWWALKTDKRLLSEVESLLRNQRGNPKFADNEVEARVFGRDPREDLLRIFQISDTEPLKFDCVVIDEVRTLTTRMRNAHSWKGFQTFVEAFRVTSKTRCDINIDENLLERDIARQLKFDAKKNLIFEWPQICNECAKSFVEDEIRFFKQYSARELDGVIKFYEQLLHNIEHSKDLIFLHLAWGSGWHGMTVGRLLQEISGCFDPSKCRDVEVCDFHGMVFCNLRSTYRLGKKRARPEFVKEYPKTRKIVFENGRPRYPLGWVRLREVR